MHTAPIGQHGQIGAVVQDEPSICSVKYFADYAGIVQDRLRRTGFVPVLKQFHTTVPHLLGGPAHVMPTSRQQSRIQNRI
jgi:hypothetical protein